MGKKGTEHVTSYSANGARWKRKVHQKKNNFSKGQTSGSTKPKGIKCRPSPLDKYMANHSRSYKLPDYGKWLKKVEEAIYGK